MCLMLKIFHICRRLSETANAILEVPGEFQAGGHQHGAAGLHTDVYGTGTIPVACINRFRLTPEA